MNGFYKAQDTKNGPKANWAMQFYKVTSAAWGCLSVMCLERRCGKLRFEIMHNENGDKKLDILISVIQIWCSVQTEADSL